MYNIIYYFILYLHVAMQYFPIKLPLNIPRYSTPHIQLYVNTHAQALFPCLLYYFPYCTCTFVSVQLSLIIPQPTMVDAQGLYSIKLSFWYSCSDLQHCTCISSCTCVLGARQHVSQYCQRNVKYRINTSFHGQEWNMAGYFTHGQYFHSPSARENTLPTREISCHIPLLAME